MCVYYSNMSFTNYTDVNVTLGSATVFASSASINSTLSMSPVRAVGVKGAAGMIPDGPAGGECSIDLVGGGGGYSPPSDLSDANAAKVNVAVGAANGIFYPTGFSISMAPNEVVSGSFSGTMFEAPSLAVGGGAGGQPGAGGSQIFDGGHGASTGSSGGQTSAEYSFSASWDAIYFIGSMCPQYVFNTEGSAEATVEGPNISSNFSFACDNPCPTQETITFSVGSLCGGSVGSYTVTGYSTGGGVTVSEGGVLSGSKTVVQFFA